MAWLNATEEGSKQSRRETLGELSPFLTLPEVDGAEYIVQFWHEAGTYEAGSMGIIPLRWQELKAWREENDLNLTNWEMAAIRRLSMEYCSEYYASSEKGRPPPHVISIEELDRPAVANKIKSIFSGFRKQEDSPKYEVEESN